MLFNKLWEKNRNLVSWRILGFVQACGQKWFNTHTASCSWCSPTPEKCLSNWIAFHLHLSFHTRLRPWKKTRKQDYNHKTSQINDQEAIAKKFSTNMERTCWKHGMRRTRSQKIHVSSTVARCLPSSRKVCDIERVMAIIARKQAARVKWVFPLKAFHLGLHLFLSWSTPKMLSIWYTGIALAQNLG